MLLAGSMIKDIIPLQI